MLYRYCHRYICCRGKQKKRKWEMEKPCRLFAACFSPKTCALHLPQCTRFSLSCRLLYELHCFAVYPPLPTLPLSLSIVLFAATTTSGHKW